MEKSRMCENSLDENILMPSQCFTINGTRGNRICIDWWLNEFAMENKSENGKVSYVWKFSLDENILIPSQYKSLQKNIGQHF